MTRSRPPQSGQIDRSIANTLRSGTSHGAPSSSSARSVRQPRQCLLVVILFGWLNQAKGKRRFRSAHLEKPRRSGKSILAAGIGPHAAGRQRVRRRNVFRRYHRGASVSVGCPEPSAAAPSICAASSQTDAPALAGHQREGRQGTSHTLVRRGAGAVGGLRPRAAGTGCVRASPNQRRSARASRWKNQFVKGAACS